MKTPWNTFNLFAYKIGVNKDTIQEWAKVYPEFKVAHDHAKLIQEREMMIVGFKGMKTQGFGHSTWIFWMKNCFGWRDNREETDDLADFEFDYE